MVVISPTADQSERYVEQVERRSKWARPVAAVFVCAGLAMSGVVASAAVGSDIRRAATTSERVVRLGTLTLTVTGTQVGPVRRGQTSAEVVPFFEDLLGPVESITTTVALPLIQQRCFSGEVLAIFEWRGAGFVFVGDTATPMDDYTLFDFRFDEGAVSGQLTGLQSSGGARVGDTTGRWRALHTDARYFAGEPDLIGPSVVLADGLHALADPTTGRVVSISAVSPIFCE